MEDSSWDCMNGLGLRSRWCECLWEGFLGVLALACYPITRCGVPSCHVSWEQVRQKLLSWISRHCICMLHWNLGFSYATNMLHEIIIWVWWQFLLSIPGAFMSWELTDQSAGTCRLIPLGWNRMKENCLIKVGTSNGGKCISCIIWLVATIHEINAMKLFLWGGHLCNQEVGMKYCWFTCPGLASGV